MRRICSLTANFFYLVPPSFFWQRMICPHHFRQSDLLFVDVIQELVQTSISVYCAWSHLMAFKSPWNLSIEREHWIETINKWSTHATPCFLFNKRIFLPGSLSSFSFLGTQSVGTYLQIWSIKWTHMILEHLIVHAKIISEALVEFKGKKNEEQRSENMLVWRIFLIWLCCEFNVW